MVSELFIHEAVQKIESADPWATIEFGSWHIHADLDAVTHVRFAEEPSHDNSVSVFVSVDERNGNPVLRFYFPHASQTDQTYTAEELVLFGRFKERHEGCWKVGIRG